MAANMSSVTETPLALQRSDGSWLLDVWPDLRIALTQEAPCLVGREGAVMVIKDAPTFEVVATNQLSDRIDASPVMIGKELYLRGHQHLYCIAEG